VKGAAAKSEKSRAAASVSFNSNDPSFVRASVSYYLNPLQNKNTEEFATWKVAAYGADWSV
jgi:hypothetical protein